MYYTVNRDIAHINKKTCHWQTVNVPGPSAVSFGRKKNTYDIRTIYGYKNVKTLRFKQM